LYHSLFPLYLIILAQRAIRPSLTLKLAVDAYWAEPVAGPYLTRASSFAGSSTESNVNATRESLTKRSLETDGLNATNETSSSVSSHGRHAVVGWHVRLSDWSPWCRSRGNSLHQQVLLEKHNLGHSRYAHV
jgi:hypothetical protein